MNLFLLSLNDGSQIILDKPILLIGRHQECDVMLISKKVSRRHCCVVQIGKQLLVRDLGSMNGVKVNGKTVSQSPLQLGDELTIGNFKYQVCSAKRETKTRATNLLDDASEANPG